MNTAGSEYHIGFTIYVHAGSSEKPGEKRNQSNADEGNPSSRNKLLNALAFCPRLR